MKRTECLTNIGGKCLDKFKYTFFRRLGRRKKVYLNLFFRLTGGRIGLHIFVILAFSSCVSHKELVNFNEGSPFSTTPEAISNFTELSIQPDDILFISVQSINMDLASPFNLSSQTGVGNMESNPELFGYRVDGEGKIDFPVIGRMEVAEMTTEELKEKLFEKIENYLKDAVINIHFLNFKVTVLGEVRNPGTFGVKGEKVTVLEALGLAGDLTNYGNRKNILVIREQAGKRSYGRVNLRSRKVFESPYFYLKQNDVVYVEPSKSRTHTIADPTSKTVTWLGLLISIITLTVTLLK